MARPVKRTQEQWRTAILDAARELFLSRGYESASVAEIMERAGGAKGMFYRFFQSKGDAMRALGDRMFFENNPFDAVRERSDLNGMQKVRELLALNRADETRDSLNRQAVSILEDPRILAAAVEANRRVLTPLWRELLEEGRRDGSIRTAYCRELSELLPLVDFWLLPSVFPATAGELANKYRFLAEALAAMGLPILDEDPETLRRLAELAQPEPEPEREEGGEPS